MRGARARARACVRGWVACVRACVRTHENTHMRAHLHVHACMGGGGEGDAPVGGCGDTADANLVVPAIADKPIHGVCC